MNYGLIVICDEDEEYAQCLADYIRIKGSLASNIVVFTKEIPFREFTMSNQIDILIIHENIAKNISDIAYIDNTFTLCEDPISPSNTTENMLFKYSSAGEILRQIMAGYKVNGSKSFTVFHRYKRSKVIGIASPIGRCGKTSLALSLGLNLSQTHSCLFLSFDETIWLNLLSQNNSEICKNLSDLLYYFHEDSSLNESRLMSSINKLHELDIIPVSKEPGIFSELGIPLLSSFLSSLIDLGRYDYIVIDFGSLSFSFPLLLWCEKIFLPAISDDEYASKKINIFLEQFNKHNEASKISVEQVHTPFISITSQENRYLSTLVAGDMGHFAQTLLLAK